MTFRCPRATSPQKLNGQLDELKTKVRIKGFRPGKVPVEHLRKVYGKSVMADVVQEAIADANKKIVDDNNLRLAREPKVELPTDQSVIEAALEARGDLNFKVALEVLPIFEVGDFSADFARAPDRRRRGRGDRRPRSTGSPRTAASTPTSPKARRRRTHDRVTVDFDGTIDGEPFEGGEGRDIQVVLGSNTFIPGFEEQLIGVAAGEKRDVHATFPETYAVRALAGQTGEFDVTVKAVAAPERARHRRRIRQGPRLGEPRQLKEIIRERIVVRLRPRLAREGQAPAARQARRALFVRTAGGPGRPGIRRDLGAGRCASSRPPAAASPTRTPPRRPRAPTTARSPSAACASACCWPRSAPRRTSRCRDEEMTQALIARARAFPGQEKQVWDFYRNNQQALAELRAPIYEEKVVDHIIGLAKVEERKVSQGGAAEADRGRAADAAATAAEPPARPGRRPNRARGRGGGRSGRRPRLPPLFGTAAGAYVQRRPRCSGVRSILATGKSLCAIRSTITPTTSCRS